LKISKNQQRIDRKENKKLIEQNNFAELEAKLNSQYKNKTFKGEDGLNWYIKSIKVLNKNEVEATLTNLSDQQKIIKKIDEIEQIFT